MPKNPKAKIYLLEDINDNRYVGSTGELDLNKRLSTHRRDKKISKGCSSAALNLSYATMLFLEECDNNLETRRERESYWISQYPDAVNKFKLKGKKKWKDFTPEQKETKRENNRRYRERNRDKINQKKREKYAIKKNSALKSKELKSKD